MPSRTSVLGFALLFNLAALAQNLHWQSSTHLDSELDEMSGLVIHDSLGYTINDSGGKAFLYGFSLSTGQIASRHFLQGIKNRDFEALTQNSTHFFIGDIGNNFANRTNFQIYAIAKQNLSENKNPHFKTIRFTLPNYTAGWQKKHDFDMEAMIVDESNTKLLIFSKNRASDLVNIYQINMDFSDSLQTARLLSQFHLQGMVTAATVSGKDLFLLTYHLWNTTLYKIPNFSITPITKWLPIGMKVKGKGFQREALWIENGVVYIGTERTKAQVQAIDQFVFK